MTATAQTWTEDFVEVAGGRVHLLKGGAGDPLLVLHQDIGNPGWVPLFEQLAASHTVYVPTHPGYGQSDRPAWMRSVRDLAAAHQWLLSSLGLEHVALLGLGMGGWIAAEMASLSPAQFRALILVGAAGLQPKQGEILDQALMSHIDYARAGFHDQSCFDAIFGAEPETEQLEAWEINREMTFRVAWKPYMFSQTLPHLLGGVQSPALIVWGDDDRVVPRECAELYAAALPRSHVAAVRDCGHFVELEQPAELARLVGAFIAEA